MTSNCQWFIEYTPLITPVSVFLGDHSKLEAMGTRSVVINLINGQRLLVHDAYYVPQIWKNLYSAFAAAHLGADIHIRWNTCKFTLGEIALTFNQSNHLYPLGTSSPPMQALTVSRSLDAAHLWHNRLCHVNFQHLSWLSSNQPIDGLPKVLSTRTSSRLYPIKCGPNAALLCITFASLGA